MADQLQQLFTACEAGDKLLVGEILKKQPGFIDVKESKKGKTPLILACGSESEHSADIIQTLLAAGANLNITDSSGLTALLVAAARGYVPVVQILLASGAGIDITEPNFKATPLIAACGNGHKEVAALLIKAGADIEAQDLYDRTPLFCACNAGHSEVVELLIKSGAKLETKGVNEDDIRLTPLEEAFNERQRSTIHCLLAAGALISWTMDGVGWKLLPYAREKKDDALLDRLVQIMISAVSVPMGDCSSPKSTSSTDSGQFLSSNSCIMDILMDKIAVNAANEHIMNFYIGLAQKLISDTSALVSIRGWSRIVRVAECIDFVRFLLEKQPELLHALNEKSGQPIMSEADPSVRQMIQDLEVENSAAGRAADGLCNVCEACVIS